MAFGEEDDTPLSSSVVEVCCFLVSCKIGLAFPWLVHFH